MREDTGERVVALVGDGRLRRVRCRPARADLPDPRRSRRRRRAGAAAPGARRPGTCYVPPPAIARGESVVVHSAAGGVGSLAVQLGTRLRRRARDRDRLQRREARAGARAGRRRGARRGRRRADRAHCSRPTAARVDVVFDMAGGEVFDASYEALAPFGRIVVYGIATGEPNVVSDRLAAAPFARGRRLLPVPLRSAPRHVRRGARGPVRRAPSRRAATRSSATRTRSSRRRRRRSTCASGAPPASCCSTRRSRSDRPTTFAELGLSDATLARCRTSATRRPARSRSRRSPRCSRAAT